MESLCIVLNSLQAGNKTMPENVIEFFKDFKVAPLYIY